MWMKDYIGSIACTGMSSTTFGSCSPSTFTYYISSNLSEDVHFLFNLKSLHEPTSFKEASQIPEWVDSMNTILKALEMNWCICQ